MKTPLLRWDIYEITTAKTSIHGIKLRGRIRKYGLEQGLNILTENASDADNAVRYALQADSNPEAVNNFIADIVIDSSVALVASSIANPVLSKLKVNDETRYE